MTFDRRARVLIADGDAALRRILSQRLLDAEVLSDCAADGKLALDALQESKYAVVIVDLALPVVSSERILAFIAEMPSGVRPVVLVLAARGAACSLDVDVVQIVLRKPCDLTQLADIVRSCVRTAAEGMRLEPELKAARARPLPLS